MASAEEPATKSTVIIAIDRSKHAEYALDWYLENLYQPNVRIILVHIPEEAPTDLLRGGRVSDGEAQLLKEKEQKEKEEILKKYSEKLIAAQAKGELKTVFGKPGEVIVEAAKTFNASLIVTGTRGMSSIRRTILGSVSDYVLHHSHIPVLVCHPPPHSHHK